MADRHRLTSVDRVVDDGSWVFTVRTGHGDEEVILVPCDERDGDDGGADGSGGDHDPNRIEAWINRCTHESQRLHREGVGAVIREGAIVCPRHGSAFDACSGYCDNGEAADTTLVDVDVTVEDGQVYLTDPDYDYLYEGPIDGGTDDGGPSSTSHLQF